MQIRDSASVNLSEVWMDEGLRNLRVREHAFEFILSGFQGQQLVFECSDRCPIGNRIHDLPKPPPDALELDACRIEFRRLRHAKAVDLPIELFSKLLEQLRIH